MNAEDFMEKQKLDFLNAKSDEIRKILIEMIGRLGVGHVGGSLSVVDLLTVLYYDLAKVDPKNPKDPDIPSHPLCHGGSEAAVFPNPPADSSPNCEKSSRNFYNPSNGE